MIDMTKSVVLILIRKISNPKCSSVVTCQEHRGVLRGMHSNVYFNLYLTLQEVFYVLQCLSRFDLRPLNDKNHNI